MEGIGVQVLGPVRVRVGGTPDDLVVPPRLRAALAALVLDLGHVVPADVLAMRVWGEDVGPAALLPAVSRLRRILEPGVADGAWQLLLTRSPGYVLALRDEAVDARRFERALAAAQAARSAEDLAGAVSLLDGALALWHGDAYADVERPFAREEALRLERRRRVAAELAADLVLQLGRPDEAVERLLPLVQAEPLDEGVRAAQVRALYAAGRQADALAVIEHVRRLLADELGVDPGPDLRELQARVLRHDPSLLPARQPTGTVAVPPRRPSPPAPPPPSLGPGLTTFVGRDEDLDFLAAALRAHRLVTVVGPGGSGKTRLVGEALRRGLVPGEVAVVELAGIQDGALVGAQVADALDVSLTAAGPVDAVVTAVQDREVTVVLDNGEHVVDDVADWCAQTLARCPHLVVLATSRQPVGLDGEAVLPCGPLPVGELDDDAVVLFRDRARLVGAPLPDDDGTRQLVHHICTRLDGLPLAIELAAACLRTLPLAEVARRVEDPFELLTEGRRSAAPHQRTLLQTVRWSVDLLDDGERRLFEQLAAFPGGFATDTVEALAGTSSGRALSALRALVSQSLVVLERERGRYRMLETLRQYVDHEQDPAALLADRDRQASVVADLVERLEPLLRGTGQEAGWARLDAEQQNTRAALAHALARGDGRTAARIAASVGWWWYQRGHVDEGRAALTAAVVALPADEPALLSRALLAHALLAYLRGDVAAVSADVERLVPAAEAGGDPSLALGLVRRGFVRALRGEAGDEVAADLSRGREAADAHGIAWIQAEIAMAHGQFARATGDRDQALALLATAEERAEALGHRWAVASSRWVRAKVHVDAGEGARALASVARMVTAASTDGDRTGSLAGLLVAAGAATAAGRAEDGARVLGAVGRLSQRIGYDPFRMDPVDGESYRAATRAALDEPTWERALAEGAGWDLPTACAHVEQLAADTAREHDRRGTYI